MKLIQLTLAGFVSAVIATGSVEAQTAKKPAPKPKTAASAAKTNLPAKLANNVDSVSYSIGVNVGSGLRSQNLSNANLNALMKGLEQALKGQPTQLNNEQATSVIQGFFQKQVTAKADANKKVGDQFLEENKKKPGIITTASGLQYQVMTAGTGTKPTASDTVRTHYTGRLIDGTVFDSSVERGEPIEFPVSGVIQGWVEALQLMPVGSKWKLFIPSQLAYGERGAGPQIGPNSTLVFDIELLDIVKK